MSRHSIAPDHFPKKVLVALPPAMLQEIDSIARAEHRTRSDLFREALRRYMLEFKRQQTPGFVLNQMKDQVLNGQPAI